MTAVNRLRRLVAMPVAAASVLASGAATAQSFVGDTFSYQVLGQSVVNTSGTAVVGSGPEFTFTGVDGGGETITYTVNINASSITITAGVGTQAPDAINFGTLINGFTGQLIRFGTIRITGLDYTNGDGIEGFTRSGTLNILDSSIGFTGNSVSIGDTTDDSLIPWVDGQRLRIDLDSDGCPGPDDQDADNDTVPDCLDLCPGEDDLADPDQDGVLGCFDNCPNDPNIVLSDNGQVYGTLEDALRGLGTGDVLELGPCVFHEQGLQVVERRDVTIRGQGAGQTIIDGGDVPGSIFEFFLVEGMTLEGVTLRSGVADQAEGGGAIVARDTDLTLRDVVLESNTSGGFPVGAMHLDGGSATIERSIFRNNSSTSTPGNRPSDIYAVDAPIWARSSVFSKGSGAAIYSVEVVATTSDQDATTFVNCTFAEAPSINGHVRTTLSGTTVEFVNCVFDDPAPPITSSSTGNATFIRSAFAGATGDNVDGAPVFVDAASGDYRLAAGSPGIDAADFDAFVNAGGGVADLADRDRTNNDPGVPDTGSGFIEHLDAGAYEFQGASTERNPDYNLDTFVDVFDIADLLQDVEDELTP